MVQGLVKLSKKYKSYRVLKFCCFLATRGSNGLRADLELNYFIKLNLSMGWYTLGSTKVQTYNGCLFSRPAKVCCGGDKKVHKGVRTEINSQWSTKNWYNWQILLGGIYTDILGYQKVLFPLSLRILGCHQGYSNIFVAEGTKKCTKIIVS